MIPGIRAAFLVAALCAAAVPAAAQKATPLSAPDGATLTLGFIDTALADGRLKAAAELLRNAASRQPGPELDLRAAELLLASGATSEAERAFGALQAIPAIAPRAMVGRAVALLAAGRPVEADALLDEALQLDPGLGRGWSVRGVLADRRRDWLAAEAHYNRAVAADPASALIRNNRGYSRLLQGRHAEAEADFARSIQLKPVLAEAATNLRLARGLQGRYAEAFTATSRDELARELNTVGVAAMLRGDHRVAQSYFSRAIEMNSQHDHVATANLAYLKHIAPELTAQARP